MSLVRERVIQLLRDDDGLFHHGSLNWTMFHDAIRDGRLDVVEALLRPVIVHFPDGQGHWPRFLTLLPLHNYDDPGAIRVIEQMGMDTNFGVCFKQAALRRAARYGRLSVVEALTRVGVDVNHEDKYGRTALYYAAEECYYAAGECYPPIVRALLRGGATAVNCYVPWGFVRYQRWILVSQT